MLTSRKEMTNQEVLEKTARIIANQADCPANHIKPESNFMEEINLNSFELLILLGELENEFDIRFSDDNLMNIVTVDDLVQVIINLIQL